MRAATFVGRHPEIESFREALHRTDPYTGYAVLYGISNNTRAWWDLEPGRAIGYEPQDDAEAWADRLPDRPEDEQENSVVGGPFAGEQFYRPAL